MDYKERLHKLLEHLIDGTPVKVAPNLQKELVRVYPKSKGKTWRIFSILQNGEVNLWCDALEVEYEYVNHFNIIIE